jgi:hypothetical protein
MIHEIWLIRRTLRKVSIRYVQASSFKSYSIFSALVKRGNRKGELLLRQVEYTATLASLILSTNYVYPKRVSSDLPIDADVDLADFALQDLDEAWEELLLCQFHDCLPGRCVHH